MRASDTRPPVPAPGPSAGNAEGAGGAGSPPPSGRGHSRPRKRTRRLIRARAFVPVLLAAMALAGTGLLVRAGQLTGSPAADNRALTDTEATNRVAGDVSDIVTKVFTYDPGSLDATARDADELLAGAAAKEYDALFAQVRERVRSQELSLATRVVRVGVPTLTDGTAEVLLFLDQTTRREGEEPTTAAAQLSVTARLTDGRWRITEIKAR